MINTFLGLLPYLFTIVITAGAALAFRQSYTSSVGQIHSQVIAAYKEQNEALKNENEILRKRISEHDRQFATIRYALKQLGIVIKVNGQFISFYNTRTQHTRVIPIRNGTDTTDIDDEEEEKNN